MQIKLNCADLKLVCDYIRDNPTIVEFSLVRHSETNTTYCLDLVHWIGTETTVIPVVNHQDFGDDGTPYF
jgi:hypothetical protein